MAQAPSVVDLLKLLEKSNCRQCNQPTCLAFAAAVLKGQRRLEECPRLDPQVAARFDTAGEGRRNVEQDMDEALVQLKNHLAALDLEAAAQRTGGRYANGKLILKIMGKDFSVDSRGHLSSDIHIHGWIAIPVLNYILQCAGIPPTGRWLPLRELKNGATWYRLFGQRCEKPLKKVADTYPDLFEDMIHLFNGRHVEKFDTADISLVLHPLPKVPILICYWNPEEGMDSNLNIFFDSTAEENLPIESIYSLGAGITRMFEKLALRHGVRPEQGPA